MADSGAAIHAARRAALARVAAAQRDSPTDFPVGDLSALSAGEEDPQEAGDLALALAEGRRRDMSAGRTLIGPHRADLGAVYAEKGVAAALCSTGEQKALLISLILANARALTAAGGAVPVLLLDEVAAHLDAGRRAALFDEICALGGQTFLTGTGPELFAELGDRAERLEVREDRGASEVRAVP
jgi:DNA replication and repair protein RecF